jgi:hypothetical protein
MNNLSRKIGNVNKFQEDHQSTKFKILKIQGFQPMLNKFLSQLIETKLNQLKKFL